MIRKIALRNYRMFREFDLEFTEGMNILVGDNDSGKSTLVEAINLALTGRVKGRFLSQEFSPFVVNSEATEEYLQAIKQAGAPVMPPDVIVDLFLEETDETEILRGTNNILGEDACGIRISGGFDPAFTDEYTDFVADPDQVRLVPTEYYRVDWLGFSGGQRVDHW